MEGFLYLGRYTAATIGLPYFAIESRALRRNVRLSTEI